MFVYQMVIIDAPPEAHQTVNLRASRLPCLRKAPLPASKRQDLDCQRQHSDVRNLKSCLFIQGSKYRCCLSMAPGFFGHRGTLGHVLYPNICGQKPPGNMFLVFSGDHMWPKNAKKLTTSRKEGPFGASADISNHR